MNNATNKSALPTLISDVIADDKHYIDNVFADTWKNLGLNKLIKAAGFSKRSGVEITEAVFLLLLWKWLSVSSIAMFCKKSLGIFSLAKKDVMYDLLKREDSNWREFNLHAAKAVYHQSRLHCSKLKVLVLDDSIKGRRGKKMEGVSSHYDHVSGRYVMGEQVLTLGLATEEAFLPLDSQIYISESKAQKLVRPFKDGRSVVAKRYQEAISQSKPQMAATMMKRAIRKGFEADYLVADAWFGTKPTIRSALDLEIYPILRMKKNKLQYRVVIKGSKKLLDAKELYSHVVRKEWKKVRGMPWKAVSLSVEVDLSEDKGKEPEWKEIQLLFVRGLKEPEAAQAGKKDWALFLTTDIALSMSKILEIYALRWGIEVYFKEAKQHLGFLAEQTVSFASHTASIHICAIRYLILAHHKLANQGLRVCDVRTTIQEYMDTLSYASRLWHLFRDIINGTLKKLRNTLGCSTKLIMQAIDQEVKEFFVRSLQLDEFTMRLEFE